MQLCPLGTAAQIRFHGKGGQFDGQRGLDAERRRHVCQARQGVEHQRSNQQKHGKRVASRRFCQPRTPASQWRHGQCGDENKYNGVIVIPQSATVTLQDKLIVYRVVSGKAVSTAVSVAPYNDGRTYIVLSGLKPGDEIVADGAGLVQEGMAINK